MSDFTEHALFDACRTLFGSHLNISRDFLWYLQPCGARSAFRSKAKETHPDLFSDSQPEDLEKKAEVFREVKEAYDLLCSFFEQRSKGLWAPPMDQAASSRSCRSASPHRPSKQQRSGYYRYKGNIPEFRLNLGLYLYYHGLIPYSALISAIVWQRQNRPLIGDIACQWKWLTEEEVQVIMKTRGANSRFGERALRLGYLTSLQVRALLRYQGTFNKKLGQYFVQEGLLTNYQIEQLVLELHEHNARVSERWGNASRSV